MWKQSLLFLSRLSHDNQNLKSKTFDLDCSLIEVLNLPSVLRCFSAVHIFIIKVSMHVSILAALNTSFSWFIYRCRSEISCSCCSATAASKGKLRNVWWCLWPSDELSQDRCRGDAAFIPRRGWADQNLVWQLMNWGGGARRSRWGAQSLHQSQATNTSWNHLRNQQRPSYNGCLMLKRSSLISPKPLIQGWGITGLFFTSSLACCLLSHENVYESDKTKTKKKLLSLHYCSQMFGWMW